MVWPGCGAGAAAGAPDTLVKAVDEALVLRRAPPVVIGGDADRAVTRLLTGVEQASLARRLDQIRAERLSEVLEGDAALEAGKRDEGP